MSSTCKIMASVAVDGLDYFGKSPVPGIYLCTAAGVQIPPLAPAVCSGAAGAHVVGRWLQNPSAKKLAEKALAGGCSLGVRVTDDATELLVIEGAQTIRRVEDAAHQAKTTYKALNTPEGMTWLMRYLTH